MSKEIIKLSNFIIKQSEHDLRVACKNGDLQKVKQLLNNEDPDERADINGSAFYHACRKHHKDIIIYLLSSPELKQHVMINDKVKIDNQTSFRGLCNTVPEIVQDIIWEVPPNVVDDIKHFIMNEFTANKQILINTLKEREAHDLKKELENELPQHINISRKPKI